MLESATNADGSPLPAELNRITGAIIGGAIEVHTVGAVYFTNNLVPVYRVASGPDHQFQRARAEGRHPPSRALNVPAVLTSDSLSECPPRRSQRKN